MDRNRITEALWKPFLSEVTSGQQVFFCFSRDLVDGCLRGSGLLCDDSVGFINEAARQLLNIEYGSVSVRPEAFERQPCGFSSVIILIAQQILAVEEMVKEKDGHSENAYFPRLRKMIGSGLQPISQNPFRFGEFETLWRVFAREITGLPGSSSRSVTFRFGGESRVNKARALPLSQAVLSRADLLQILRKIGLKTSRETSASVLFDRVRSIKGTLGRRAQRIIALPFLRERIVGQLKAFASSVSEQELIDIESESRHSRYELRIYKDSLDWMTAEYRVFLFDSATGAQIESEEESTREIERIISRQGLLFLPLNNSSDYWVKARTEARIENGGSYLIVVSHDLLDRAKNIIKGIQPGQCLDSFQAISLNTRLQLFVIEQTASLTGGASLVLYDGGIRTGSNVGRGRASGTWLGGYSVDSWSNKFLVDFLPKTFSLEGREHPIESLVTINGRIVSFETFRDSLELLTADDYFEIGFPGNVKARLGVAVTKRSQDGMGFVFGEEGRLMPVLDRVSPEDESVVGFSQFSWKSGARLNNRTLALLIRGVRENQGTRINSSQAEILKHLLTNTEGPMPLKDYLLRSAVEGLKLPTLLISELGLA